MKDWKLRIYYCLPFPARSIAAGLRGYYLRSWRYGPESEGLVAEATERESWTVEQWKSWREGQLAYVLHRAATRTHYYREQWMKRRRCGDRASWEYLENWPILEKEPLRQSPTAFVADDCDIRTMFHEHTSGTTGKSLDLWFSRKSVRLIYALFEARVRRWHGVSRHDRWAIMGGQIVTPTAQRRPPFWVWNSALNQLYLSSYHLAPDLIPAYLDALRRYRVTYIFGYTSSLYALAQEVLLRGKNEIKLKLAITNAEPLFDYQRQAIAKAFQCPVRETYEMTENVSAASECPEGRLHLWPELGYSEIIERNQPVSRGVSGDLVCTGLLNADMPLIRYRVGDRVSFPPAELPCNCIRTLESVASVVGRSDDMLYTVDGRQIGRLDPVFKSNLPVREAQIIQEELNKLRIRFVPAPDFTRKSEEEMVERLRARMGNINVVVEQVEEIPRTANGKFQAVICKLPAETRTKLS